MEQSLLQVYQALNTVRNYGNVASGVNRNVIVHEIQQPNRKAMKPRERAVRGHLSAPKDVNTKVSSFYNFVALMKMEVD